jgi:hypothetical protein
LISDAASSQHASEFLGVRCGHERIRYCGDHILGGLARRAGLDGCRTMPTMDDAVAETVPISPPAAERGLRVVEIDLDREQTREVIHDDVLQPGVQDTLDPSFVVTSNGTDLTDGRRDDQLERDSEFESCVGIPAACDCASRFDKRFTHRKERVPSTVMMGRDLKRVVHLLLVKQVGLTLAADVEQQQ